MDALGKLLKKVSRKDQVTLLELMLAIKNIEEQKTLDIIKLSGGGLYRVKKGNFRIIFHFENGNVITDSVRLRNEKTYRDV